MKVHMLKVLQGLVLFSSALLVTSCGGGGDIDDQYQGAAPLSLNGVTFNFGNARLTFSSPSPNSTEFGTETGGIVYERGSDELIAFSPVDPDAVDALELSWPEDLGASVRYQYTHTDDRRGELLIFATNFEDDAFIYHPTDSDRFDIFSMSFIPNGDAVPDGVATITTWASDGQRYTASRVVGYEVGGLTDNPLDLPLGWDGSNDGPGFIAPASFAGYVMTMTEDGGGTEIQFSDFSDRISDPNPIDRTTETGTCTMVVTTDPGGAATVTSYSVTYTHEQLYGTEDVVFSIEYPFASPVPPFSDEVFTFTFLGGESLTAGTTTVPVRTGEYVSSTRPAGLFVLDIRAPATP